MGKARAGEEITGLAKEQASYRGIRVDKSRACRCGSESTFTSKGGCLGSAQLLSLQTLPLPPPSERSAPRLNCGEDGNGG